MDKPVGWVTDRLDDVSLAREAIAFDAVRSALSASYCLLFAERVADRQVVAPLVEGVDPAYGERLQLAAVEQLLPEWLCGLREGIVVDRAALQRDHDFAHSDFYNYVIRPEGRFHCLIATPYVTPTRRYHLIVGRPSRSSDFVPAEVAILRALLPHVGRLIALANDAAFAAERCCSMMAAFDSLGDNIVIVSENGSVEFANIGARRLLTLGDGLSVASAKLRGMNVEATAALLSAIARVTAICGPDEVALHLPRPSGSPPYRMKLRRVVAENQHSRRQAMLVIEPTTSRPQSHGQTLSRLYGLTARELDLALLLSQGIGLRAAAARLGITYQTARFHLRNAFSKMDVHRQSDLVRRVICASSHKSVTYHQ